jgi:hypothetical protein
VLGLQQVGDMDDLMHAWRTAFGSRRLGKRRTSRVDGDGSRMLRVLLARRDDVAKMNLVITEMVDADGSGDHLDGCPDDARARRTAGMHHFKAAEARRQDPLRARLQPITSITSPSEPQRSLASSSCRSSTSCRSCACRLAPPAALIGQLSEVEARAPRHDVLAGVPITSRR